MKRLDRCEHVAADAGLAITDELLAEVAIAKRDAVLGQALLQDLLAMCDEQQRRITAELLA